MVNMKYNLFIAYKIEDLILKLFQKGNYKTGANFKNPRSGWGAYQ